jgi:pimeloyl-ACP methyl ester carboxylesterase
MTTGSDPRSDDIDLDGPFRFRTWDGPSDLTFVMLHGLGGSSLSWNLVAPELAALGRVLAPDLVGFGETPRVGRGTGTMDQRRTLSRFLEGRGTGRVVLVGNSWGGLIAVIQAAVEPSSVAGLVLTCSVFPSVARVFPHPAVRGAFSVYDLPRVGEWFVGARYRRLDTEKLVRAGFRINAADPRSIPEEVIAAVIEQERSRRTDPEAAVAFLDAARSLIRLLRRPDVVRRAFDGVTCPVLVVHGRRDRLVPSAWAEAELARHPAWRGRIFPDLGHIPQLEAPGRWLSAVVDWLDEARR